MPRAYGIAHVDVNDMDVYKKYIAANEAPFAEYGVRFLVRGGQHQVPEGGARQRTIALEFEVIQMRWPVTKVSAIWPPKIFAIRYQQPIL